MKRRLRFILIAYGVAMGCAHRPTASTQPMATQSGINDLASAAAFHPVSASPRTTDGGAKSPDRNTHDFGNRAKSPESARDGSITTRPASPADVQASSNNRHADVPADSIAPKSPDTGTSVARGFDLADRLNLPTTAPSTSLQLAPVEPTDSQTARNAQHVDLPGPADRRIASDNSKTSLPLSTSDAEQTRRRLEEEHAAASEHDRAARSALDRGVFDALIGPTTVPAVAVPTTRPTLDLPWK